MNHRSLGEEMHTTVALAPRRAGRGWSSSIPLTVKVMQGKKEDALRRVKR